MDLTAETAYFKSKIRKVYADDLKQMASIPPDAISEVLSDNPFPLSNEALEAVRKQLEYSFSVRQDKGAAILSDYKPWLSERRGEIEFRYWNRLRNYFLGDDVLPENVVSRLDEMTNDVLDYSGNPQDGGQWKRRGMVMGHVQSGKTTNYASLISKAADSGYKIIILLAGMTNSLRKQTQDRMDEHFIGKRSLFNEVRPELMPIMTYCDYRRDEKLLHPAFGTTFDQDFHKAVSNFGVSLDNLRDPIIFVTKKNKSILTNLYEWIDSQAPDQQISYPLLLVDDEADNASVNTKKKDEPGSAATGSNTTAINGLITDILGKFSRSTYVGYTATPFANIFIDPDTEEEMEREDLFPRHFIKALDPPTNYVGATRVFSEDGDLRADMVNVVASDDYEDILPLKHPRTLELKELPSTLLEAIRVFVLARAIRILRGDGHKHCSMMINVSRFNDVQEKVHGLVYEYQKQLDDAIRVNAGLGTEALRDPDIKALETSFRKEYSGLGFSFAEILSVLAEASRTIVPRTINMKGGELDYDRHKTAGLHIIAIGGLALARGLTLEGLAVTYILRNAGASDTLMQMARWFGYRQNYQDICRLYICKTAVEHYEYIADAIEELRSEIKRMEVRGETPEDFGLKVRRSETGIRITAANKMRTAKEITLAQSFETRHVEGYALENNRKTNEDNLHLALEFLEELGPPIAPTAFKESDQIKEAEKHLVWLKASGSSVLDLIRNFRFHAYQPALGLIDGRSSLFSDYCSDRIKGELSEWDVVAPLNLGRDSDLSSLNLSTLSSLPLRNRNSASIRHVPGSSVFKPTGDKNSVRDPKEDPPLLLAQARREQALVMRENKILKGDRPFCAMRARPLMLIHFFRSDLDRSEFQLKDTPIVSLSFCMPKTKIKSSPRSYQVNKVYQKQLETLAGEADDDEALFHEQ